MLYKIIETELDYKMCFCNFSDKGPYYKLEDPKLPDMRAHNNIIFKPGTPPETLKRVIKEELNQRRSDGYDFLKIISFDPVPDKALDSLGIKPEVDSYDYMVIQTASSSFLKYTEKVEVMHADSDPIYASGRWVDLEANKEMMGEAFTERRIDRKIEIYKNKNIPLEFYVCYYKGEPAGNCELYSGNQFAKIEDLDILPPFQKRGLGTHFLKDLLEKAYQNKIASAYIVTDHFDSAKEMYKKCGFKYEGNVTELLYNLI
ncbi:MAG: GNAT family N-acetyltransferase [Spirochaetales bacterium]|nr:GNAT family N-acetyltransferase [Spirochaetales bacterium]